MRKKILWPIASIIIALLVATLMLRNKPSLDAKVVEPTLLSVNAVLVEPRARQLSVRTQGSVEPVTETKLVAEVSGTINWVSPALVAGGKFDEGELLFRIDERDYRSQVGLNKAELSKAEVEKEHNESEFRRLAQLHKKNLASRSDLDRAGRALKVAEAHLQEMRIKVEQAERDLQRTSVYAPYAGRVRSENVDVGQFVSRGQDIASIYAFDQVEIRVPIANQQISYLDLPAGSRGQFSAEQAPLATVTASYGRSLFRWHGKLVRTAAEVDARNRMFYGFVKVSNDGADNNPPLAIGLFVNVDIAGRMVDDVVTLPRAAIRDNSQVLTIDDDNRLHFRQVEILRLEHDEVLIQGGLEAGERVCISPLQVVIDGMQVKPVMVPLTGMQH